MTTITIMQEDKALNVSVRGHCERDVCIAVSAITNTLAQFCEDFRDKNGGFRTDRLSVRRGNTQINVNADNKQTFRHFMNGADALLLGYALYADNFPQEIKLDFQCRTFKK